MHSAEEHLATARRYLEALGRGAVGSELAAFFREDAVQEELPNRLKPQGDRCELPAMLEAAARGQQILAAQRYEVQNAVASGNQVALEVVWTGTPAVAIGSIPAGGEMRVYSGMFLTFRDGKIAAQRNYDCFEPF